MDEKAGVVFSIAGDNQPIAGCTVSKAVYNGNNSVTYFSLAKNTDISAEIYSYPKMIITVGGTLEVYGDNYTKTLNTGDFLITPVNKKIGTRTKNTENGAVYVEILLRGNCIVNELIKPGEVFKLADIVPYADGKTVNMDIVHNDKMKFAVMAFDAGMSLAEHAAPGEAIVFALDGEGIITYEGVEHKIKAGENFHFAKSGRHAIKAVTKFKMALLLTLE